MSAALRKSKEQKFTYQDYLTWPDEERWEIIDGIAYNMCPAPVTFHQRISMILSAFLETNLEGKKMHAFPCSNRCDFIGKQCCPAGCVCCL